MSKSETMYSVTGSQQIPFAACGPMKDSYGYGSFISASIKSRGSSSSRVDLSVEQTNRD